MGSEIERKFLVTRVPDGIDSVRSTEIRQGYVAIEPGGGSEVRVRERDGRAELTVKRGSGQSRGEDTVPLEAHAFARLWPLTDGRRIEKTRYELPLDSGRTLELDVYGGRLEGLVTAEAEFDSEADADAFEPPTWLGDDVTADARYKNQQLATVGLPGRVGSVTGGAAAAGSAAVSASEATAGSAAVAAGAATGGSAAVVASAATAGSVVVAASAGTAASVGVAASAATFGSAGVFASMLTAFGAAISGCVATLGCLRCERCVGCVACIDCVDCVGCFGCVGLRGATGRIRRARWRT